MYAGGMVALRLDGSRPRAVAIFAAAAMTLPVGALALATSGLDAFVAHQKVKEMRSRGHVKRAPLDYLKSPKVNLDLSHPESTSCSNPRWRDAPTIYVRLGGDDCLHTTYLTPTPELTAYVCAHPKDFVLE